MPVPLIGAPNRTPLTLDTDVMTGLPEVTTPVGDTEVVAEAFEAAADPCCIVTVSAVTLIPPCATKELEGIFVPLRSCADVTPGAGTPALPVDTKLRTLLLLVVAARNHGVKVTVAFVVVIWPGMVAESVG
jgi:hypothetical protein